MMPPQLPPHHEPPAGLASACGDAALRGSSSVGAKLWWKDRVLSPDFLGAAGLSSLVRAEPVEEGVTTPAVRRLLEAVDDDSLGVFGRDEGRGTSGRWKFSSASSSSSSLSAASSWAKRCREALAAFLGGGAGASAIISSSASSSSTVFAALGGMLCCNCFQTSGANVLKCMVQLQQTVKGIVQPRYSRGACIVMEHRPGLLAHRCYWCVVPCPVR
jgi:hypothetical protein